MRSGNDFGMLDEFERHRIFGWLFDEDIQRGTTAVTILNRVQKCFFVHDATASYVYNVNAFLAFT